MEDLFHGRPTTAAGGLAFMLDIGITPIVMLPKGKHLLMLSMAENLFRYELIRLEAVKRELTDRDEALYSRGGCSVAVGIIILLYFLFHF